ncbi:hypothetical protein Prudu_1104S000100 [Prunus dulcis]|uniref:Uncharacterized protein n=1 Tax=Prunus dulcis TaxID=3755 RepID=A0A5H2XNS1_PRUDU|nr:hypothetical protein Prudu_1104S000100 [Prunus dulcis]
MFASLSLARVAFGFFKSQHKRLIGEPLTSFERAIILPIENTRKVFSEYHNVPMDTHKVFTALVQWDSCRSPSVIHNREQFGALFLFSGFLQQFGAFPPLFPVLRGTDRVEPVMASRLVWVEVTSHYSHPLNVHVLILLSVR